MGKKLLFSMFFIQGITHFLSASDRPSSWVFLEFNDILRAQPVVCQKTVFPTLSAWSAACKTQPKNREGADFKSGHSGFASLGDKKLQWEEFNQILSSWFEMMVTGPLKDSVLWQKSNYYLMLKPDKSFYNLKELPPFMPYAQKIIARPGDQFFIRGDLHGDIFSLLAQLEKMRSEGILTDDFRIISDNVTILFLGDYVDRGQYGCEVLYTMLRLSLANPDRVVFVRGNHEDINISVSYGFKEEVHFKFDDPSRLKHKIISRMNDLLPVVLYIGCQDGDVTNYLQCCHGGLEIGYKPQSFLNYHGTSYQLLGLLHQESFVTSFVRNCEEQSSGGVNWLKSWAVKNSYSVMKDWWERSWKNVRSYLEDNRLLQNPSGNGLPLGFMWNDFSVGNKQPVVYRDRRGLTYGQELTQKILELQSSNRSKICGVFRAHQHGDPEMMEALKLNLGVYELWSHNNDAICSDCADEHHARNLAGGIVWTFNVGADSLYGQDFGFNFDAYARLVVQKKLDDWKLQVFNTRVI